MGSVCLLNSVGQSFSFTRRGSGVRVPQQALFLRKEVKVREICPTEPETLVQRSGYHNIISGYGITAIISAFQADDASSILATRSNIGHNICLTLAKMRVRLCSIATRKYIESL